MTPEHKTTTPDAALQAEINAQGLRRAIKAMQTIIPPNLQLAADTVSADDFEAAVQATTHQIIQAAAQAFPPGKIREFLQATTPENIQSVVRALEHPATPHEAEVALQDFNKGELRAAFQAIGLDADRAIADTVLAIDESARAPGKGELAEWMTAGECPESALTEASERLAVLWGEEQGTVRVCGWMLGGLYGWKDIKSSPREFHAPTAVCLEQATLNKLPNPLAPILRAWLSRPPVSTPDLRRYGIVPNAALNSSNYGRQGQLFALPETAPVEDFQTEHVHLPELTPTQKPVPATPLALFDAFGLKSLTAGRGASLEIRLWLEAMMAAPVQYRQKTRFHLSLREVIDWLWPNGWNATRDPDRLREAFHRIDQARLPWEGELAGRWGKGLWRPVTVVSLPTVDPRSSVVLDVELPPGSCAGPLIDRHRLRRYGLDSAPAYRAYLNLVYHWNEHLTHQGGKRLHPSRPVVQRGKGGVILDLNGQPVLGQGGRPVKSWADPRAVRTGEDEENPVARRYGGLRAFTPEDLMVMSYSEQDVAKKHHRKYRSRAVEVFQRMADDGALVMEKDTTADGESGWRLLPPSDFGLSD